MADLPRSFWRFYLSLFRSALLEAYGAVDALLTLVAFVLFLVTLFSKELAHQLETRWQGLSRWYSAMPVALLFVYRLMRVNYGHYHDVVEEVDELEAERQRVQQPDVVREVVNGKSPALRTESNSAVADRFLLDIVLTQPQDSRMH